MVCGPFHRVARCRVHRQLQLKKESLQGSDLRSLLSLVHIDAETHTSSLIAFVYLVTCTFQLIISMVSLVISCYFYMPWSIYT